MGYFPVLLLLIFPTIENLTLFEKNIRDRGIYDFRAGRKILPKLKNLGMEILLSENLEDLELTGSSVVSSEVYTMWENRLNRLSFDNFFQDEEIEVIKSEFLSILKDTRHINQSKVKFIFATSGLFCINRVPTLGEPKTITVVSPKSKFTFFAFKE